MEINAQAVLQALVGLLAGVLMTSLAAYFGIVKRLTNGSSQLGRHESDIKTLFNEGKRRDRELEKISKMHIETIRLITKVVDQNNSLVQKVMIQ